MKSLPKSPRGRIVPVLLLILLVLVLLGAGGLWYSLAMPGRSYAGRLGPLTDQETRIRDALRRHVEKLAGDIGERHVRRYEGLQAAAQYVERTFEGIGYQPADQEFTVSVGQADGTWADRAVRNIEAELGGSVRADEIIVVGAHYDSIAGCPAANDNGSGVAAMLEIARLLHGRRLDRTVRFVAFVNEEPPFFRTEQMGSRVYARRCRQRGEKIVAMFSLETIGYYSDRAGSQTYPPLLAGFYPDTGDFIAFVGNFSSRDLVRRSVASFRRHTEFPSQGGAPPGYVPGVGLSDHWSFWQEGYPAVMVTDTAPFRYPHYHAPTDTPDRIDYDRTARVTTGLARVMADLAGSPAV